MDQKWTQQQTIILCDEDWDEREMKCKQTSASLNLLMDPKMCLAGWLSV